MHNDTRGLSIDKNRYSCCNDCLHIEVTQRVCKHIFSTLSIAYPLSAQYIVLVNIDREGCTVNTLRAPDVKWHFDPGVKIQTIYWPRGQYIGGHDIVSLHNKMADNIFNYIFLNEKFEFVNEI